MDKADPNTRILLAEDDNATEVSLVENAMRTDMHPDDQCAAFDELVENGLPVEDVAARFGVTPAVVRQRLKLAKVSPRLRKLFRAGDVTLAQMMALALVDDHEAQEKAWADLPEWNREPHAIRRSLTAEGVSGESRLARFVTVEAYEAAGGIVLRDLFEAVAPTLADAALVETLAVQKMAAAAEAVKAEGWVWVKTSLTADYEPYDRVYPQQSEDEQGTVYDPHDIAMAGARLTLNYDGELQIERGLVERGERRAAEETEKDDTPAVPAYSEAVLSDLTAHKTAAIRLEMSKKPLVALAATAHAMGISLLYNSWGRSCLNLSAKSDNLERRVASLEECSAHAALASVLAAWQETLPADPDGFWDWCLAADQDKLLELLALLAGLMVDAGTGRTAGSLAQAVALDMRQHWTPKADGFFGRLSKPLMAHLLTEAGDGAEAGKLDSLKKGEAAAKTAALLAAREWLPTVLG